MHCGAIQNLKSNSNIGDNKLQNKANSDRTITVILTFKQFLMFSQSTSRPFIDLNFQHSENLSIPVIERKMLHSTSNSTHSSHQSDQFSFNNSLESWNLLSSNPTHTTINFVCCLLSHPACAYLLSHLSILSTHQFLVFTTSTRYAPFVKMISTSALLENKLLAPENHAPNFGYDPWPERKKENGGKEEVGQRNKRTCRSTQFPQMSVEFW